ncbi:chemotaxis-specific protein-glutamate methyltransferase CheB [uncultured Tateyamaria sp.]|uniref:chemotaxis-specific protein-glutamate methyltransferase CheB n=1 Tax=uncultured Tateyamaria sp. TaxID=455651 RepID=UPI00263467AD|nr:chemotaxis-specific protein-glutamate methyltransferase CheB [uncultured Tateyamaria sp.]
MTSSSSTAPKRVVVVDDSLTMRRWLSSIIAQDPRLDLVGMAGSAQEARETIKATEPDVLTLDIEMPGMNGVEFLAHLMRLRPMPVVMLSGGLLNGNAMAERAMELGAVACLSKPQFPTKDTMAEICDNIFAAATGQKLAPRAPDPKTSEYAEKILLVGASTGGVAAIESMLGSIDKQEIPPVVIAQHMPHRYLKSFVQRLDRLGSHDVDLSSDGMRLKPGSIRLAPSQDRQTCVVWHSGAWHIQEIARQYDQPYCPSVDVLFASAVPWAQHVGAVLLTGLGNDGAKGMLALRRKGARTLGQSKSSCVVYGMPGVALSLNASEAEAEIEDIGGEILTRMRQTNAGVTTS